MKSLAGTLTDHRDVLQEMTEELAQALQTESKGTRHEIYSGEAHRAAQEALIAAFDGGKDQATWMQDARFALSLDIAEPRPLTPLPPEPVPTKEEVQAAEEAEAEGKDLVKKDGKLVKVDREEPEEEPKPKPKPVEPPQPAPVEQAKPAAPQKVAEAPATPRTDAPKAKDGAPIG